MDIEIKVGTNLVKKFKVEERQTAKNIGSGSLDVFATPALIATLENVSMELLQKHLPNEYTSVGIEININHLKASLINDIIDFEAKVIKLDGKKVHFDLMAYYENTLIAKGSHVRFIINSTEFMNKLTNR